MEIPYEILIKYCRNEASSEEIKEVEAWLEKEENAAVFSSLKEEWSFISDNSVVMPDKEKVWKNIQSQTLESNKGKSRSLLFPILSAASVILILIVSVGLLLNRETVEPQAVMTANINTANEKQELKLPDGTFIWLNENSSVSYNEDEYNKNEREIFVQGELFLDVAKSDKKFILHAEQFRIEVLGTSFNVKTLNNDGCVEIVLQNGSIAVYDDEKNKQMFMLTPSQRAIINKNNLSYTIHNEDTSLYNVWTSEDLSFYNESFQDIVRKLEIWYGIDISYEGIDPDTRYTLYIQDESITEFLDETLSVFIPVDYKMEGNKLFITPKNSMN